MEQLLVDVKTFYIQHTMGIVMVVLACIVILMIINLAALRRCRKQIRELREGTRDVMKLAMRKNKSVVSENREISREERLKQADRDGARPSMDDEELFGSVIQEIFP